MLQAENCVWAKSVGNKSIIPGRHKTHPLPFPGTTIYPSVTELKMCLLLVDDSKRVLCK
jgi:hypothetical protein